MNGCVLGFLRVHVYFVSRAVETLKRDLTGSLLVKGHLSPVAGIPARGLS